jgi:hypothetical protein
MEIAYGEGASVKVEGMRCTGATYVKRGASLSFACFVGRKSLQVVSRHGKLGISRKLYRMMNAGWLWIRTPD